MSVSEVMCPVLLQFKFNKEIDVCERKNRDALEWSAYKQGGYPPSK